MVNYAYRILLINRYTKWKHKMNIEEYDIIYVFEGNLDNNKRTYEQINELYELLEESENQKVIVNFKNVNFLSANLFAVLGACMSYTISNHGHKIYIADINRNIKELMCRNGFNKCFNWEAIEDKYNRCIRYSVFAAKTEQLEEFEKYLLIQIFQHQEIPTMSESYRDRIIDNFLEIFNNVIDHSMSSSVFVCGQFFPKSKSLRFSIVDVGLTFSDKLEEFYKSNKGEKPKHCIEWAIQFGHSTKTDEPGGLGLTTLLEFLQYNHGRFCIVSGKEFYDNSDKGTRTMKLKKGFPGTIVTIEISLKDEKLYLYDDEKEESIVF